MIRVAPVVSETSRSQPVAERTDPDQPDEFKAKVGSSDYSRHACCIWESNDERMREL
jgi:hypothetical protein